MYTINSVINTSIHVNMLTSILSLQTCLLDFTISILPGAFQRQCLNPRRHLGEGELTLSRSLLFLRHYAKYLPVILFNPLCIPPGQAGIIKLFVTGKESRLRGGSLRSCGSTLPHLLKGVRVVK